MKNQILGAALVAIAVLVPNVSLSAPKANTQQQLLAANAQFYAALNTMFTGEFSPMSEIWSHRADVIQMGPFGGRLVGWSAVGAEFKKVAAMKLGGRVVPKDVLVVSGDGNLGYTVCVEEGEHMSAGGRQITVKHRATNIFRRENGAWKLAEHHTDISTDLQKSDGAPVH